MTLRCILNYPDQTSVALTKCLRFTLLRERYLPFAQLSVQFAAEAQVQMPCEIILELDGTRLHQGLVLKASCTREKGQWIFRSSSRSYTAVLTKNQLVPGIHSNVSLQSLMETYHLPNITYDSGTGTINYIYVKENAAMWDTVIAYNYKLCGGFPYIRVPNMLCMMPQAGTTPVVLPADQVIAAGCGGDCSEMLSRVDMANAAGEYGAFTLSNPEAVSRNIVRVRQITLDKQYLYAPEDALRFRIALSNRKMRTETVIYAGYCGEDIEDLVQIGTQSARVSRILLSGDMNGLRTEDSFYFDPFCNT
ncbi:MAG: hypothetical protein IKQ91_03625 [Oscillospiraceae bacterium]|nr:hypothetical protein [Oscillospiraceae bacterium]